MPIARPDAAALEAALAVVAEAVRRRGRAARAPSSSFVRPAWFSNPASVRPARELAVEQHVADHPALAGDRVEREEADARQLGAVAVAVEAAEQLVAAADGEDAPRRPSTAARSAVGLRGEVDRDERLLAVLAAADVEQVVRARLARASPIETASTSSSCPRQAARRASTAMLPRSA